MKKEQTKLDRLSNVKVSIEQLVCDTVKSIELNDVNCECLTESINTFTTAHQIAFKQISLLVLNM